MLQVARAAGVHQSTVSLALRGSSRISAATTEKVCRTAQKMGYRPNPLVSALVASRKRRAPVARATMGYVIGDDSGQPWPYKQLDEGIYQRAAELGYRIDRLPLGRDAIYGDRFAQVAQTRDIHGLIIAPLFRKQITLALPWERFAAVAYGYFVEQPSIHRVTPDFFRSMIDLLAHVRQAGWSRVGLILNTNKRSKDHLWLAAFLAEQRISAKFGRIPPLLLPVWSASQADAWFRRHRPEAVISLYSLLRPAEDLFKVGMTGIPLPRWYCLDIAPGDRSVNYPGVVINRAECGRACVDILADLLNRNQIGIPARAHHTFIETEWRDGSET